MPDDRRIEWAESLSAAEDLLVGGSPGQPQPQPGQPAPAAGPSPDQLKQARAIFHDMQQAYASGDYVRYGQLMQQLGQLLSSH
jgi:predicted lipid-binding transport protein (Tim44 family)